MSCFPVQDKIWTPSGRAAGDRSVGPALVEMYEPQWGASKGGQGGPARRAVQLPLCAPPRTTILIVAADDVAVAPDTDTPRIDTHASGSLPHSPPLAQGRPAHLRLRGHARGGPVFVRLGGVAAWPQPGDRQGADAGPGPVDGHRRHHRGPRGLHDPVRVAVVEIPLLLG